MRKTLAAAIVALLVFPVQSFAQTGVSTADPPLPSLTVWQAQSSDATGPLHAATLREAARTSAALAAAPRLLRQPPQARHRGHGHVVLGLVVGGFVGAFLVGSVCALGGCQPADYVMGVAIGAGFGAVAGGW
jgi:hypothetical protein